MTTGKIAHEIDQGIYCRFGHRVVQAGTHTAHRTVAGQIQQAQLLGSSGGTKEDVAGSMGS